MTLTDMPNKKHSTYTNDATFYLVLGMDNDRTGQALLHFTDADEKYITPDAVKREITSMLQHWIEGGRGHLIAFAQNVIENWLSSVIHWLDWPAIVAMYKNPDTVFTKKDVHDDDKMVASMLLSSSYTPIILKDQLNFDAAQVLTVVVQNILGYYATTPYLWTDKANRIEAAFAQRIFNVYLDAVNWTQVCDGILATKKENEEN